MEFSGGLWGAGDRGGIRTTEDAKFYAFTAKVDEEFDNADADQLVFAFSVKCLAIFPLFVKTAAPLPNS